MQNPCEGTSPDVDGLLREGLRVIRRGVRAVRPAARAAGYWGCPDADIDNVDDDNIIPDGFALQEGVLQRIQRLVPAARPFAQAAARAEVVHSEAPSSDDASDDDTASLFVEGAEEEFFRFNDELEADNAWLLGGGGAGLKLFSSFSLASRAAGVVKSLFNHVILMHGMRSISIRWCNRGHRARAQKMLNFSDLPRISILPSVFVLPLVPQ